MSINIVGNDAANNTAIVMMMTMIIIIMIIITMMTMKSTASTTTTPEVGHTLNFIIISTRSDKGLPYGVGPIVDDTP